MLLVVLRCLACLMLVFTTLSASAKPKAKPAPTETIQLDEDPPAPAAPAAPPAQVEVDEEENEGTGSVGIECAPAISEVETRRQIPFSCSVTKDDVEEVEIRYKAPGRKKWTKLRLRKSGTEYVGDIPCNALTKRGILKLSVVGLDGDNKTVARIGGVQIHVVDASNQPPPSLPGKEPPMRCFEPQDCPPELQGSPACPGTKAKAGLKSWGASCGGTSECQTGLDCVSGTCEKPAKCDTSVDCGTGECVSGTCHYPDPEELASRLGPPKYNWIGLHFGVDMVLLRQASGVCGSTGTDAANYTCYSGSDAYSGTPNNNYAGTVNSGFGIGTMRVLASYERWLNRLALGVRLGFAFNGAPKDFFPLHMEARVLYSVVSDPLNRRFRPYIGLAGGLARVDSHSKATIVDCINNVETCKTLTNASQFTQGDAVVRKFDAYKEGSTAFFGPTIGFIMALSNEAGIAANLNVMLPDLVFEPSVGYVMGL
jgi:hypothetical protein